MYITWGTKPYGTCDTVPDLFYVATWFFHVNHLPLFPLHTNLVLAKHGDQYHVVKLPLSLKSVLLAWTRTATFFASTILCVMTVVAFSDPRSAPAKDYGGPALATAALFALSL